MHEFGAYVLADCSCGSALGQGEVQGGCRHTLAAGNDRVRRLDEFVSFDMEGKNGDLAVVFWK